MDMMAIIKHNELKASVKWVGGLVTAAADGGGAGCYTLEIAATVATTTTTTTTWTGCLLCFMANFRQFMKCWLCLIRASSGSDNNNKQRNNSCK